MYEVSHVEQQNTCTRETIAGECLLTRVNSGCIVFH